MQYESFSPIAQADRSAVAECRGLAAHSEEQFADVVTAESSRPWGVGKRLVLVTFVAIVSLASYAGFAAFPHKYKPAGQAKAPTLESQIPFRLYDGSLAMPTKSDQYDGIADARGISVHEQDGGVSHVFAIGDWGAPIPSHITFGSNGEHAQESVAGAFKDRASWAKPDYVLNVGDNLYVSGVDLSCNTPPGDQIEKTKSDFAQVWQQIYGEWANIPWISVLGNHDYGGWRMDRGWPQQIGYSFINYNWIMPARYYSKRVPHPGYDIDYFMIDSNAYDAKDAGVNPDHNICGPHNYGGVGTCAANSGPPNVEGCKQWFWGSYAVQKQWLKKKLAASNARWKIVVTHFPCGYDSDYYKELKMKYGLDLLITGHRHQQELWKPGSASAYVRAFMTTNRWDGDAPACFVTGGGGGIASQRFPYGDYGTDLQWYGFFHLTIHKDWMKIELVGSDAKVWGNMTIHPHGSSAADADGANAQSAIQNAGGGTCASYCGDSNNPYAKVCPGWGWAPWMSCGGCQKCFENAPTTTPRPTPAPAANEGFNPESEIDPSVQSQLESEMGSNSQSELGSNSQLASATPSRTVSGYDDLFN